MNDFLLLLGRIAGIAGLLLCVIAGATRILGSFYLGQFQTGTLLQIGVAALAVGCFFLLWVLCARFQPRR